MKKLAILIFLLGLLTVSFEFEIKSKDIIDGAEIDDKFSPYGKDVSPSLEWENIPEGTKSFALSVEDPDAPVGLFYHWVVINIPVSTNKVPQGKVPKGGVEVKNSWGIKKYKGPRPPSGTHHYHFVVYALNKEIISVRSYEDFKNEVNKNLIDKAEIVGTFESKN